MVNLMLICGLVLLICIASSKVLYKFGVPMLVIFILLGMLFGSDGIVGIYFDNYQLTSSIASIALVFIMFYGGFGTNWKMAKPVAVPSILMSSMGVVITAILTGLFCHFVLGTSLLEGFLIGSIVSSTDAASVFAILRSQKLNLKNSLASLLEVESGSNDPFAYMLTLITIALMNSSGVAHLIPFIIKQLIFGITVGSVLGIISVYVFKNLEFEVDSFYVIFITAIVILAYALSEFLGGNGYLSVYMCGIIIGNSAIPHKRSLVHFFDGISWIMQISLFFLLGLLSFPSKLFQVKGMALAISIFMIFIARPLTTFLTLAKFKFTLKEKLLVSWVGLRGAASIVFAIYAVTQGVAIENDIFHIVFFTALLSVAIQGTLTPVFAKKLGLVDNSTTVLKTFNDYAGEITSKLIEINVDKDSPLLNKPLTDCNIPEDILILMIKRKKKIIFPKGSTVIRLGDTLVFTGENLNNFLSG